MIATKGQPSLGISGINQQDFGDIQLLIGAYPFQIGLQQRIPGKTLERVFPAPVGSIYVFYLVYGRAYRLTDFGDILIEEIPIDPIRIPGNIPKQTSWFDNFSGYSPIGLISKYWAGGQWLYSVGICETLIQGYIDPFRVSDTITPINDTLLPHDGPPPVEIPDTIPERHPVNPDPTTEIWGGSDLVVIRENGFSPPYAYDTEMHDAASNFIVHPYNEGYSPATYGKFSSYESLETNANWGGFLNYIEGSSSAIGYYTVNQINLDHILDDIEDGDTIVLVGEQTTLTSFNEVGNPIYTTVPVEINLGKYPDIPPTFVVKVPVGSPVWENNSHSESFNSLIFTDYDVYKPV